MQQTSKINFVNTAFITSEGVATIVTTTTTLWG